MAKAIKPTGLSEALEDQLYMYHQEVIDRVDAAGERAAEKLVKLTKATAPKDTGTYKRSLTYKKVRRAGFSSFVWHARAPFHRLTHLLVHGHATVDGGRVPGDPFLENALGTVLPEYEREVEEALKND